MPLTPVDVYEDELLDRLVEKVKLLDWLQPVLLYDLEIKALFHNTDYETEIKAATPGERLYGEYDVALLISTGDTACYSEKELEALIATEVGKIEVKFVGQESKPVIAINKYNGMSIDPNVILYYGRDILPYRAFFNIIDNPSPTRRVYEDKKIIRRMFDD